MNGLKKILALNVYCLVVEQCVFFKYGFDLKSETFAKLLLAEKGVFFVPGSCFDKEYYFRLGLAQDSKLFKAGLDELSNFVDEHLISC